MTIDSQGVRKLYESHVVARFDVRSRQGGILRLWSTSTVFLRSDDAIA